MKRAQVKAQNARSARGIYNQATPPELGMFPGKSAGITVRLRSDPLRPGE